MLTRLRAANFSIALIAGYFLYLTREGLRAYFSEDDLMNLYKAWTRSVPSLLVENLYFFGPGYRPLGHLFYRVMFALAGFHPRPFRVACYVLLLVNLWLAYTVIWRLSRSREISVLATLLFSYHAGFKSLYYDTGTVFDILCFLFFWSAFLYYINRRETKGPPDLRDTIIVCGLFICALNSKEMAVSLPAFLLAYEWWYRRPAERRYRTVVILAIAAAAFSMGKTLGPDAIARNPDYSPHLSFSKYLDSLRHYLGLAFYAESWMTAPRAALLTLAMVGFAFWRNLPALHLGWVALIVGILPVAFIAPRGLFVLYVPAPGIAMYLAALLVEIRIGAPWLARNLLRLARGVWNSGVRVYVRQAVLLLLIAAGCLVLHCAHYSPNWLAEDSRNSQVRAAIDQIRRIHPSFPRGAHVLFLGHPFPPGTWNLTFLLRLYYHDDDLVVDYAERMDPKPDTTALATYDAVFDYNGAQFVEIKAK